MASGNVYIYELNAKVSWNKKLASESRIHSNKANKSAVEVFAANIEKLLANAVLLDSEISTDSSKSKMPYTEFMHSLYTIANLDGTNILVKIYIEQAFSKKSGEDFYRAYDVKYIEKVAEFDKGVLLDNKGLTQSHSATEYSVLYLYSLVKTYDKSFHPAPEANPLLLNKDGTPRVFYHQTNARFTEFNTKNQREGRLDTDTPTGLSFLSYLSFSGSWGVR